MWNPCISEPTSCPVKLFCAIITEQQKTYDKHFSYVLTTNTTNFITYNNINRNNKFSSNYTTKETTVINTKTVTVNRKGKIKKKNQKGVRKKEDKFTWIWRRGSVLNGWKRKSSQSWILMTLCSSLASVPFSIFFSFTLSNFCYYYSYYLFKINLILYGL